MVSSFDLMVHTASENTLRTEIFKTTIGLIEHTSNRYLHQQQRNNINSIAEFQFIHHFKSYFCDIINLQKTEHGKSRDVALSDSSKRTQNLVVLIKVEMDKRQPLSFLFNQKKIIKVNDKDIIMKI